MTVEADVLVIGSGIAGLFYTLRVADHLRVAIVTKKETVESNTNYAQGGIASVFSDKDSFVLHRDDTISTGAGLCHPEIVDLVVHEGPTLINALQNLGVGFTMETSGFDLGMEGGHSRNRIVHAKDFTGKEVERVLVERIRQHPNVQVFEEHVAIDLITEHNLEQPGTVSGNDIHCWGAYVLDKKRNIVIKFLAGKTVLSSGGIGQVYLHSTNPEIATGDGVAMAYRAGALVANMEFVQFHPTTLYHPDARSFLISEAIRGHGALLLNSDGDRFMEKYDARKELAPRDIVARAIDRELKRSGTDCVYLDLTHIEAEATRNSFPSIYKKCREVSIDITKELIPVVPSAHYACGGICTDSWGKTTIEGLYVCGEAAMTGLHGANRLASNSLLEAVVFASRAAEHTVATSEDRMEVATIMDWDDSGTYNSEEWVLISHNRKEVQTLMWDYVGIVRSNLRLERAKRRIDLLQREIENFYKRTIVSEEMLELRNLTTVASLIIRAALRRKESRGLHYTTDYPETDPALDHQDFSFSILEEHEAKEDCS